MDFAAILGEGLRSAFSAQAAAYALLAIGLNLHFGYTGLLNFGQVAFMLVGAYGVGITVATFGGSMWLGLVVSIALAIILALIVGVPTLRLRADYFAITTIAVAEVLRLLFRSSTAEPLTGGPFGLQSIAGEFFALNPIPSGSYGIGRLSYSHAQLWVLLVTWALAILLTIVVILLVRSPWGRVIKAIRDDEDVARGLGKNVFSYKLQSLAIGGAMGALGGAMFAISGQTVNPDSYLPEVTFIAYTILIIGGVASRVGPLLGAVIFWFLFSSLQAAIRQAGAADYLPDFMTGGGAVGAVARFSVGVALVLLLIYRPQGILGNKREMILSVTR